MGDLKKIDKSTGDMLTSVARRETSLFVEPVDTSGAEKAAAGFTTS
jgi:hypothetical protein